MDERGLTEPQRRFLLEMAGGKTRREAEAAIPVSRRTVQLWLKDSQAFRSAYDKLYDGTIGETKSRLGGATATAADVLLEAMNATKDATFTVTCPECEAKFEVVATIPNHQVRLKASEIVLKGAKVLKDVKEISGSVTTLSMEERVALSLFKAGKLDLIPSHMWERLIAAGVIPEGSVPPHVTVRVIDGGNE